MGYKILTKKTIISYLLNIESLRDFFDDAEKMTVQEIGDGNLNLVFVVSQENQKLIIKQSLPYLRCAGEGYPLAKERMHYEIKALQLFDELVLSHVPKIYYTDKKMCLIVMEYLENCQVMRKGMMQKIYYPNFAEHISTFLAKALFKTSSLCLDTEQKSRLMIAFRGNELRKLTENFVFTFPYMQHETNVIIPELKAEAEKLFANIKFKENILKLKYLFMNKTDALLHGDLHTGSIMLNQDNTYVIDAEFAFVGPFGFDLGVVLANLIMSWISHFERSKDADYQEKILQTILNFLNLFKQKFLELWNQHVANPLIQDGFMSDKGIRSYQNEFMRTMLQETVGFAGCEIARRQLGKAGVEDIRAIADTKAAARAEKMALAIAQEFVVYHHDFDNAKDIIFVLWQFAKKYYPSNTQCKEEKISNWLPGLLTTALLTTGLFQCAGAKSQPKKYSPAKSQGEEDAPDKFEKCKL